MADPAEVVVKCCFCIRDLSKLTSIACAECPAVLCVKCFQYGAEAGKHKRGHNYEIHSEDSETLFNRQWGREDEQNLIQTVHRYKLGNWDEVTAVISKGGLKRTTTDVARHFQLYFVQSTLGRTAMKEKEWIERRDDFKDDITKVICDPSGRELYYHAVIEALRTAKELPNINDRDIVKQIDQLVSEHFASLNRTERKRKASEVSAALSKARQPIRKEEAFPYGESDDDAWWERMCRVPREKKELDRYYEEQSVCTEEKCMAEAVDTDNLAEIMRMMKDAGLEDHEELGKELKALRISTIGEEKKDDKHQWGSPQKEAFKSRLERPEPEAKRAKITPPEQSDRPHLAVDMNRKILMEAVIDDQKLVKQLEGKKFFEARIQIRDGKNQESSYDEADNVNDVEAEQEGSGASAASDSDSEAAAFFDYEAYEAKMRAAGYQTDEMYSDWDEASYYTLFLCQRDAKEELTVKLRELAQSGGLFDSSEEGDEDEQDEAMAGVAESSDDGEVDAVKTSLEHCGLEEEAESAEEDEEEVDDEDNAPESADGYSSDDDESVDDSSSEKASSSEIASEYESETEQLDALFGAPAMRLPKDMRKEKKRPKRTVKFYELGSDDEYHTMDEENAALPMIEMSIGASRKAAIVRRLREEKDKYYDTDQFTGRLTAKMPRPPMSPYLEAEIRAYGKKEFARVNGESYAVLPRPPSSSTPATGALPEDTDRTPEARFGDATGAPLRARFSPSPADRCEAFNADHPAFQKYLMEHLMDESDAASACSSSDCESISSEAGERAMAFLGYPLTGHPQDADEVYEDAQGAPAEENDTFEDAKEEVMEHDGMENGKSGASEPRGLPQVKREIKEEEPDQSLPQEPLEPLRVDTRVIKAEPDDSDKEKESSEKEKHPEDVNDDEAHVSPDAEEEEDSEGVLYQLAEEGQGGNEEENPDDNEEEEKAEGEEGEEQSGEGESDEDCVAEVEGLEQMCLCHGCTKDRWAGTLGKREHALWEKIKKAGLSLDEVKAKLKRHFVDGDSDSCESSDSDEYFDDENEEPEEVYVDAVQINDTDWKIDLNSTPIPVSRNRSGDDSEASVDASDDELRALIPPNDGEDDVMHGDPHVVQKMEIVDESDRPASSTKATESTSAVLEDSLCGLEDEKEEQEDEEEEEEEDDKDKTPPMLQGDEKKKGDDEVDSNAEAPEEHPRSPILVIKKIQARGRTNLRVETRPRTPQEDKKVVEKSEAPHPQPPAKKKKISKEFEQLFKDLEIRKWEESQAKTLKERATKAIGTKREKSTRSGAQVAISDNSEAEQDPRPKKKKSGGKKLSEADLFAVKPTCSKNVFTPEDTPRGSRRSSITDIKKKSVSPKKMLDKKGTKRVAEVVESEKEESSGDEDEEETNGDGKSPQKKRRKHKRTVMSKKERKAKWDRKIQNRKAREEQKVEEIKAVVSSVEFFEQHEVTFFSNVFRRIAFDYEDHGFRNRVNFKSWVNEIYNMGYNQDRDDLDFEYYNDAEQIISRLNITNTEGGMPVDMETEIKLAKVDRYLRVLQERRALRNQAAEYETIPDFLQLCRRMNNERRKLKDIIKAKPAEEKFDNKLSSVLARDELLEMKAAKQRLLKIRARTDKLKELHAAGVATLEDALVVDALSQTVLGAAAALLQAAGLCCSMLTALAVRATVAARAAQLLKATSSVDDFGEPNQRNLEFRSCCMGALEIPLTTAPEMELIVGGGGEGRLRQPALSSLFTHVPLLGSSPPCAITGSATINTRPSVSSGSSGIRKRSSTFPTTSNRSRAAISHAATAPTPAASSSAQSSAAPTHSAADAAFSAVLRLCSTRSPAVLPLVDTELEDARIPPESQPGCMTLAAELREKIIKQNAARPRITPQHPIDDWDCCIILPFERPSIPYDPRFTPRRECSRLPSLLYPSPVAYSMDKQGRLTNGQAIWRYPYVAHTYRQPFPSNPAVPSPVRLSAKDCFDLPAYDGEPVVETTSYYHPVHPASRYAAMRQWEFYSRSCASTFFTLLTERRFDVMAQMDPFLVNFPHDVTHWISPPHVARYLIAEPIAERFAAVFSERGTQHRGLYDVGGFFVKEGMLQDAARLWLEQAQKLAAETLRWHQDVPDERLRDAFLEHCALSRSAQGRPMDLENMSNDKGHFLPLPFRYVLGNATHDLYDPQQPYAQCELPHDETVARPTAIQHFRFTTGEPFQRDHASEKPALLKKEEDRFQQEDQPSILWQRGPVEEQHELEAQQRWLSQFHAWPNDTVPRERALSELEIAQARVLVAMREGYSLLDEESEEEDDDDELSEMIVELRVDCSKEESVLLGAPPPEVKKKEDPLKKTIARPIAKAEAGPSSSPARSAVERAREVQKKEEKASGPSKAVTDRSAFFNRMLATAARMLPSFADRPSTSAASSDHVTAQPLPPPPLKGILKKPRERHESMARFKPRTKFGRSEEQKKVDERQRGTLLEFDEKIASQLERLSLISGHNADEERQSPTLRQSLQ